MDETSTAGLFILDIGGSSPNIDQGALIELGYPIDQKSYLSLIYLQMSNIGASQSFPGQDYIFSWGILKYFHGRAERVSHP